LSGETIDAEITMTFSEEFSCTPRHTVCNAGSAVCSRFTASLLIVLVMLPFTEPFSSCDLSMLRFVRSPMWVHV